MSHNHNRELPFAQTFVAVSYSAQHLPYMPYPSRSEEKEKRVTASKSSATIVHPIHVCQVRQSVTLSQYTTTRALAPVPTAWESIWLPAPIKSQKVGAGRDGRTDGAVLAFFVWCVVLFHFFFHVLVLCFVGIPREKKDSSPAATCPHEVCFG